MANNQTAAKNQNDEFEAELNAALSMETEEAVADDDLDSLLDDLEDTEEEQKAQSDYSDEEAEAAASEIEFDEARDEAYREQDKEEVAVAPISEVDDTPAPTAKKSKRPKVGSTANMDCSKAIPHKLGEKRYEVCVLTNDMAALEDADLKTAVDKWVGETDNLPKKVREKVLNTLCHINSGVELSNYTKIAIDLLLKNGKMSSDDLRAAYIARPYSPGTANAQSSQMFKLLPYMGIATRVDSKHLELNKESILADLFQSTPAA